MNDEELNEAPAADLALLRQPESETLELLNRSDATAIGRTVCAFLNGQGGRVLVGMEENGRVRGVPRAAEAVQAVQKDMFSRIQPPATCAVSVLPAAGHELLLLEVARGADGPYTYADVIYIRTGTATRKANHENVISLVRQLENAPRWETRPYLGCNLTDLDKAELRQTADEANKRRYANLPADPERLLDSLYLLRAGALTNAAVALFARDAARFLPQTRVRVVHFADESREKILDNKTFTGHIFSLQAQLLTFLQASLPVQASLRTEGFVREESIAYPLAAVREGLVNALVHRDYSRVDGSIVRSLAGYALMAATSAIVAPLGQMIIRDRIAADLGWETAGLWQAMWKISETHLLLLTSTLSVYFLPRFSEIRVGSELRHEVFKGYAFVLPVVVLSACLLYALRQPLIAALLSRDFMPLADVLGFQLMGDVLKIGSWVVAFTMISHARTRAFVVTEILFTALLVVASIYLTQRHGLKGSAAAYALTYALYWATMYWMFERFASALPREGDDRPAPVDTAPIPLQPRQEV